MLKQIELKLANSFGFEAIGEFTKKDYIEKIKPIFENSRKNNTKVSCLFYLGSEFDGFTPGALWEDIKLNTSYLKIIERCALVTDIEWVSQGAKFFGAFVPFSLKVIKNSKLEEAKTWLTSGETGIEHHLYADQSLLTVEIKKPIFTENFEVLTKTVDSWAENNDPLAGVVIRTRSFPGWENLGLENMLRQVFSKIKKFIFDTTNSI